MKQNHEDENIKDSHMEIQFIKLAKSIPSYIKKEFDFKNDGGIISFNWVTINKTT